MGWSHKQSHVHGIVSLSLVLYLPVLPRFEVTLEVPEQLTREEDFILGTVSAQ